MDFSLDSSFQCQKISEKANHQTSPIFKNNGTVDKFIGDYLHQFQSNSFVAFFKN